MMDFSQIEAAGGNTGVYSDLFKDCYGFRPRGHQFESLAAFNAEFERLATVVLPAVMAEEHAQELRAVAEFELAITRTMGVVQGCSRAHAIELLKDAEGMADHDNRFFEWHLGVPGGYVTSQMEA